MDTATPHMNSDSRGAFLTPSRILAVPHIQLRKLVPSGRGAISQLKGKTGKQRLFFIIHYMLAGFDLCVMQSRVKLCLSIMYRTSHRHPVSQASPAQCLNLPQREKMGKICRDSSSLPECLASS